MYVPVRMPSRRLYDDISYIVQWQIWSFRDIFEPDNQPSAAITLLLVATYLLLLRTCYVMTKATVCACAHAFSASIR